MLKKVLIVRKKSAFESYLENNKQDLARLLRWEDEGLLRLKKAHLIHYETLESVLRILEKKNIRYRCLERGQGFDENEYDCIFAVGGDGTFLEAAHWVRKKMIVGVNSDKQHSVGKFCASDTACFEKDLERMLRKRFLVRQLNRMEVTLNGHSSSRPVLNDVLICHACPAAMSHYVLKIGRRQERQRGSGLWVATAAGSSGAAHSAGGKRLPFLSRSYQYLPRELYEDKAARYVLRGGRLQPDTVIEIESQMQEGMVYYDGAHHKAPFEFGSWLTIRRGRFPLKTVTFER